MSGMGGMGCGVVWKNVNGGERCGSLTKPKQAAGVRPPLLFVKASWRCCGGGAWLWR